MVINIDHRPESNLIYAISASMFCTILCSRPIDFLLTIEFLKKIPIETSYYLKTYIYIIYCVVAVFEKSF